jgi:hypothetical protein
MVVGNLGVIVTVLGWSFRLVYKFARLEGQVKALHKRLDDKNGTKYNEGVGDEEDEHD